jgi:replicative DNA helicase
MIQGTEEYLDGFDSLPPDPVLPMVPEPPVWEGRTGYGGKKRAPLPTPSLMVGRPQPQALDVELAVLGALLLERDALPRVIDTLKPEIFFRQAHRLIYGAVAELFANSEPVDVLTVAEKLRSQGNLEKTGGMPYLAELTQRVASSAHIEFHAHILVQKYIQRELIRISAQLVDEGYSETTDVFELLDKAERDFYALSGDNLRRESQSMDVLTLKTIKRLEELRNKTEAITGISTGFHALDEMTAGWQPSDLVIVAARPAMGKTAFVLSLLRHAAVVAGKPVVLFSLEMAADQLVQRMLCAEAELDQSRVRTGKLEDSEWQRLNQRIGQLSQAPIYIDDTPSLNINDFRAKCRRLKAEKKIELIVIDYLQLMSGNVSQKANGNREQEIAHISRTLKQLAKELNVPVIALSQLSRAVETRGGDKRPMLSDLRESGSIEQDADMVMFLYRPEYYGLTTDEEGTPTLGLCEVIVGKQRNGPVGTVKLEFVSRFGKFQDWDATGVRMPVAPPGPGTYGGRIQVGSRMNAADDEELDNLSMQAGMAPRPPLPRPADPPPFEAPF